MASYKERFGNFYFKLPRKKFCKQFMYETKQPSRACDISIILEVFFIYISFCCP